MLKLQAKYDEVMVRVMEYKSKIIEVGKHHKEHKQYMNFEIYFSAVIRDALYRPSELCNWYEEYKCHDKHIVNLFIKVLKDAGIFEAIG